MTSSSSVRAGPACGRPSPSPRPTRASASRSCPRSTRCAATPSPPRAAPAGAISAEDSLDEHAYDTISGGDWLCDQDAVEAFVAEAPRELLRLEHWGCPWSREPDGHVAVRAFGGMKKKRTWFAADKTGFHLLHTLFQTSLKYPNITRYDEWYASRLIVDDGRVCGVVALELMSGLIETITGRSVVIATGGGGRVFPFTTNAAIKTGDGMALAYRAGAPLKDMEFVQYHPTGLPFTGILITEAARAEGGWLLNKDGYRYLQDYDLGKPEPGPVLRSMELGPRDRLSQAFVHEVEKGRTIDSPYGPVVHLDLRHLGAEGHRREAADGARAVPRLRAHRPGARARPGAAGRALHDGRRAHRHRRRHRPSRPVRRRRDGVREHQRRQPARLQLAAGMPGLRRARRAGRRAHAAEAAAAEPRPSRRRAPTSGAGSTRTCCAAATARTASPAIRKQMQEILEDVAGIYRDGDSLTKATDKLRELKERAATAAIDDTSRRFNTERVAGLELAGMLELAECIVHSALRREESRGAHQRTDFPERDDKRFLAHSLVHREPDGSPRVSYLPVTITRWPPGKRVYGR